MAKATAPTNATGTTLEVEDFTTPDTYHALVTTTDLPDLGDSTNTIDVTALQDSDHTYIEGDKAEPGDFEVTLQDVPGNVDHEAFIARAMIHGTARLRVTYTNGRIAIFNSILTGYKVNPPKRGEVITISITAKRTGAIAWT